MEKIKLKENKNKIYFQSNEPKIKLKYPHLQNQDLQKKISLKKEFQYKYDGQLKDIIEEDKNNNICNYSDKGFELSPHQEFVKRFMNYNTPYNGLLLYHGLGSGKTCSAIGITEEFRKANKYNSNFKKIIIVAYPNVQENFKLQLFDHNKLKLENNIWNLGSCVGSALLSELKDYDIQNMKKEQIVHKIEKIIRSNYAFMGYEKFAKRIEKIGHFEGNNEVKKKANKEKLKEYFEDSMIVIDEVHNIRLIGDKNTKKTANSILKLVQNVKKMKLLFLSGTPMYNDPKEILFLINLLNINDNRSILYNKEVFDNDNNLIVKNGEEIGKQKLIEKANGYISYVRGENPYSFPYKIFPSDYNSKHNLNSITYPLKQFNGKTIKKEDIIQNLDIYLNNLEQIQREGYDNIIQKIISKYSEEIEKFEDMDSFSYNLLQEPLYSLNICYKNEETNTYYTGKSGLEEMMTSNSNKKDYEYNFEERIFNYKNIGKYSIKIKNILDHITKSEGIVLVYSQLLDGGLIPLALALEEYGFKRAKNQNLFSKKNKFKPFNILTKKHDKEDGGVFKQAKYAMITGDIEHSPNNNEELELLNSAKNLNGETCKVVLISQAGSEGLDFKNLRQVHIMEPWYNLNRIEQIIGRAIRNCSHKNLPLNKRNCQIYLHSTYLDEDTEAIDLMMYRNAEKKSQKIGIIQKILKSISVDCLLNHSQTNFTNLDQTIKINLSTGLEIDYNIKDKSYSSICDYQKSCDFKCLNTSNNENTLNNSSYNYYHTINEKIIDKIKKMFSTNHVYRRNDIFDYLSNSKVSNETIENALTFLVESKNEYIIDKYLRKGVVVNIKDLYLFQPIELESNILINDRKKPLHHKIKEIKVENLKDIKATMPKKTVSSSKSNKIKKILDSIKEKYEQSMTILDDKQTIKNSSNYYEIYGKTVQVLNDIIDDVNINNELQNKFILEHILGELRYDDEVILIEYLFKNSLDDFEQEMRKYYEQFIYKYNEDITLLILINLENINKNVTKQKVHIPKGINILVFNKTVNEEQNVWRKISRLELMEVGLQNIQSFIEIKDTNFSKYIGFLSYHEKKDLIALKIKETSAQSKKNKGAFVFNKQPKEIKELIDSCIQSDIFKNSGKKGLFDLTKEQLSVILELIVRYYEYIKKDGLRYFLDKLEYVNI